MSRHADAMLIVMTQRQMTATIKFCHWCITFLGLPGELAFATWEAFTTCQHGHVRSFVYHWQRLCRQPHRTDEIMRFVDTSMTPQRLCACLEACVETGVLDRSTATEVEEAILYSTLPDGRWREAAVSE
jgi:hypothetical protein